MNEKKIINFITIIILAMICINVAGIFLYKHERMNMLEKNPIYFALGIGFAGLGAGILLALFRSYLIPKELNQTLARISNHVKR